MKIVIWFLAIALPLSLLDSEANAQSNPRAKARGVANSASYGLEQLGKKILSAGYPRQTGIWKFGRSLGYERRYVIAWDFYESPKSLTLEWTGVRGVKMKVSLPPRNGRGSRIVTLPANAKDHTLRVVIEGDASAGWEYELTEHPRDGQPLVNLSPYPVNGSEAHRAIFGASPNSTGNLYADVMARLRSPNGTGSDGEFVAFYDVQVPPGTRAFRVTSEPSVWLVVKRIDTNGSLLPSASASTTKFSYTTSVPNVVSWEDPEFTHGLYRITASSLKSGTYPLKFDCFQQGHWLPAGFPTKRGAQARESENILVGIESKGGADLQLRAGRLALISHGRTDSPKGKVALGDAAGARWETTPYFINWSQGSYWNTTGSLLGDVFLDGSRFIGPTAEAIGGLLKERGVLPGKVDFIGHSWGTFVGWQLAKNSGELSGQKFHRFFALDPARIPPRKPEAVNLKFQFWDALKLDFRNVATHSMTIHGKIDSLKTYGDRRLAQRADHKVFLFSTDSADEHNLHTQPVKVMEALLQAPTGGVSSLLGTRVRLKVFTVSGGRVGLDADQGEATVGDAVEYPRLGGQSSSLTVVPGSADIGESYVRLDYSGLSSWSFGSADFNGYIFSFSGEQLAGLKSASVNPADNTLGLTGSRIAVADRTLSINVSGLPYNSTSKARIDLQFDSGGIARAFDWILGKEVDRSRALWLQDGYQLDDTLLGNASYSVHLATDGLGGIISMKYKNLSGQEVTLY